MNPLPEKKPRVIVGVHDSAAARWALAWAIGEARLRRLALVIVHAVPPPNYAGRAPWAALPDTSDLDKDRGAELINLLLDEVAGGPPPDITVLAYVVIGEAGRTLIEFTGEGDILVVGRGRRTLMKRLLAADPARLCQGHAPGTVVTVAPPTSADLSSTAEEQRAAPRRLWSRLRPP
ncbi:hypothetical protein Misp01_41350 [Microtetraspora sp. NBRC 13810]|uniref:universal stress protein n=1 Tax=Microtetraspora sp. NBRC 13810 TaxID=3030990 RepID=UPI002553F7E3|nr:universal stress protein [Microtetraspora sp. NBRC 13810]GLW09005.1 hypothetical protein Misp01_41350 [Microtetraspora sp. NBRC 13810]